MTPYQLSADVLVDPTLWKRRGLKQFKKQITKEMAEAVAFRLIKDGHVKIIERGFSPHQHAVVLGLDFRWIRDDRAWGVTP